MEVGFEESVELLREKAIQIAPELKLIASKYEKKVLKLREDLIKARRNNGNNKSVKIPNESKKDNKNLNTDKKDKKTSKKQEKKKAEQFENVNVSLLELRVGKILEVNDHENADSLYVEKVNFGDFGERTIVSGLKGKVEKSNLLDKNYIFITNLKPSKLRGVVSEGMILCASNDKSVEPILPPDSSQPGSVVTFQPDYISEPAKDLEGKGNACKEILANLRINSNGTLCYKNTQSSILDLGPAKTLNLRNAKVS
ncbi:MAG: Aminoacyl tRNA synthase complex-interacting multifunctional protein 1 [Paramarteilia canceri]